MAATKTTAKTPKKKTAPKKPAGPVDIPTAPAPTAASLVPGGSAAAYAQYAPLAVQAAAGSTLATYSRDPKLASQNIVTGIDALAPFAAALKLLPAPFDPGALAALPAIAQALIFAAAKVDRTSPGTIRALQKTAGALRELMLSSAVTLMKSGDLPAPEVQHIVKGSGPIDQAQDCVDLAVLYTKYAPQIVGKTPVTQAQIDEARDVGDRLLQVLKPGTTPRKPLRETNPDVAIRDALGAYLVAQHDVQMRRPAYWIWGDDFEEHVPRLHSHERAPKTKDAKADGAKADGAATTDGAKTDGAAANAPNGDATGEDKSG
jgi:hypothetical protein